MRYLPNLLSISRMFIGPLVGLCLYVQGVPVGAWLALLIVILAEISDVLDGMIARSIGSITALGKLLDPLADSLYRFLVFLVFLDLRWVSVWLIALLFSRDLCVAYVRTMAQQRSITLAARSSGKIKAVMQSIGLISVLVTMGIVPHTPALSHLGAWLDPLNVMILWLVALITVASGVDYAMSFFRSISGKSKSVIS